MGPRRYLFWGGVAARVAAFRIDSDSAAFIARAAGAVTGPRSVGKQPHTSAHISAYTGLGYLRLRDYQHAVDCKLAGRSKENYYAVVGGLDGFTGIVKEWYGPGGALQLTNKVSRARFKRFGTESEAAAFIARHSQERKGPANHRRPQPIGPAEQGEPAAAGRAPEQGEPAAGEQEEPAAGEQGGPPAAQLCVIA